MIRCSKWSTFRCCKWSLNPVWRGSAFGKPFPSHINPRVSSQFLKVLRSWRVLHILTSKCASRHNGVQFFISHLARWLRTRRFSESKGWMRALCSFADYLVTSVHLRGSPENVLFPESISDQKSRKRDARRMGKSEEVVSSRAGSALRTSSTLRTFKTLSTIFLLKKNWKTHEPVRWVHTIETGT